MKKIIFLLLICPLLGNSQVRLGHKMSDIYSEFQEKNPRMGNNDDGIAYMAINFEKCLTLHYFTDDKVCFMTIISPNTQGDLNFFVEYYNQSYVILSPTSWRMYSTGGGNCDITLMTNEGQTYFVWK